ncbi:peptidoglycan editing factor PgeF [Gracilimonas sp.]|uniref:peptidoglycan editing factor PgeF n=1 Tax=Gracilimonas sp. TaxID=1974203 RepID=UPI0028727FDF|nr:peptidoglycan editing factor PgeF [Gracilimonas sp.]
MMSSRIKFIKPSIFESEVIDSWFTLRNHYLIQTDNDIPGLNLGLNTAEKESIVLKNRKLLAQEIDTNEELIAFGRQIHKTDIKYVIEGGTYQKTDGFVTDTPGLALAIQVADCAAILLADEKNKVIGAAHAGWRGAVANIVPKVIDKMVQLGAEEQHIKAYISPCISQVNFEVGEEVASEFPKEFVDRKKYKKPHVDLKGFIRHQIIQSGMLGSNIELDESCTIEGEQFYSYRRQGQKSGRMMGIIKLK